MQQFEFCFSLSFTFLNGLVAIIECAFLGKVENEEGMRETELFGRISEIANPVHKDLEALSAKLETTHADTVPTTNSITKESLEPNLAGGK
jgi:hypothetical protein